jgi:hypothetical protein
MKMRFGVAVIVLGMSALAAVAPPSLVAQEPRLEGRLPDAARMQVNGILDAARAAGLPTEPLVDRALEGVAKDAPPNLIVSAVIRLREELSLARDAFGETASSAELTAGASALRAGASSEDLAQLRTLRPEEPLTVATAVLADLVAAGVPVDTAITAVLALARDARDADYVAFRRNVERDIALGASPAAALGVRLQAVSELADAPADATGSTTGPRKRRP